MPDMPVAQAITSLELTVAFNKSDSTFGWNGFNRGLMLYYLRKGSQRTQVEFTTGDHTPPWSPVKVKMKLMFPENMDILWLTDLHHLLVLL